MKIAYLITAYNNYNHLKRLVSALNDRDVVFFIHIDKKSNLPDTLNESENIIFIERTEVWWAGWSQVDVSLRLLRTATGFGFDYYILISGTDYPIRPNSFLYSLLSAGGEFINIQKGFNIHKSEDRIKYYYFDCFDRRNRTALKTVFFLFLERAGRVFFQKKTYPFDEIYHGSSWWALSHDCIMYVLNQTDTHQDYIRFYQSSYCPDESFFHTIIGNSPFLSTCRPNLTYVDWHTIPSPARINRNHVDLFKKQTEFNYSFGTYTPFFARKFDDSSAEIVDLIDRELRK